MVNRNLAALLLGGAFVLGACDGNDVIVRDDAFVEAVQVPIDSLLADPLAVAPDPNGNTPLAAEAVFTTRTPTQVTVEVLGEESVRHTFKAIETEHRVPILGLYPGAENTVVIRLDVLEENRFGVDTLAITTEPLPDFFPKIDILKADRARMEEGWTLSSFSIANDGSFLTYPLIFDAQGDVRWYLDLSPLGSMAFAAERFANGNLRIGNERALYEYDMLGAQVNRWDIPDYWFHHEVIEKPDSNLIVAVDKEGIGSAEDHIIEIDRASGAIVREWDFRQILDVARRTYPPSTDYDWFHMNAIWYVEEEDAFVVSGRNQGVVKVTGDNELVWILAPHEGWGPAGVDQDGYDTSDYLLTAVDAAGEPYPPAVQQGAEDAADFSWTWGQHAPLLLPNGNVFVFDNGLQRNFSNTTPRFSRGVEYAIDEEAMTVEQVWEYGADRGEAFYSAVISDVDYLPETGNRLIMPGIVGLGSMEPYALVTEVAYPSGDLIFEAKLTFKNQFGTGELVWGQLDLVYRSERLPLYPQ